jgi:hypothetical protein
LLACSFGYVFFFFPPPSFEIICALSLNLLTMLRCSKQCCVFSTELSIFNSSNMLTNIVFRAVSTKCSGVTCICLYRPFHSFSVRLCINTGCVTQFISKLSDYGALLVGIISAFEFSVVQLFNEARRFGNQCLRVTVSIICHTLSLAVLCHT